MTSKKFVVYLTMYTGDKLPKWYIGSSSEDKVLNGYNGTILSKEYKEIYKLEQKENKHLFKTRILSYHETREEALVEELRVQKMHSVVKNSKYINMSYASINGYFGKPMKGVLVGEKNGMYGRRGIESPGYYSMRDKVSVKDEYGNIEILDKSDDRFISREYVGVNYGKKGLWESLNEKIRNGEMQHPMSMKLIVKYKDGKEMIFNSKKDTAKYLNVSLFVVSNYLTKLDYRNEGEYTICRL